MIYFAQGWTKIGNNQFSIDLPKGFSWNESLSGHVVFNTEVPIICGHMISAYGCTKLYSIISIIYTP